MVSLMLVRIVWMNSMSHISRYQEGPSNCSKVVLLLRIWLNVPHDSLTSLHNHIAISSLCASRSNFLVVKKHDHRDLLVLFVTVYVVVNQRVQ
jgi:hypothetical protein